MKIRRMLVAATVLLVAVAAKAQQMPPLPIDEKVKIGKLDNGLTYYLRHNEYPEHVASFYIAQRVGSINEDEDQRGLAHLLEHLAFNGTDHFKDNDLQEYLQSIGVEYGRNLNAYTAADETVYYFTDVPTTRSTAVDSCMLILKDWSNGITLTQKAIDDERDIVHNEYRMRMVGQQRMLERCLPQLYPGSKYGQRMPIGLMEVIDGCSPEAIRSYYRKWYRPDNQCVVIVGDIDVDQIEQKIKDLFSGITVPADAAQVLPEAVPNNNEAIYIVDKDKEQQMDVMMINMKHDPLPKELKGTYAYLVQKYIISLMTGMLNQRYAEKSQDPDCPYLFAQSDDGSYLFSSTMDAFSLTLAAKPGMLKEAYAAVLTEAKRAHDFGFTATEFTRAKEEYMSRMEKVYDNRDKMKNEEFTMQYVRHYLSADPIPSLEDEYQLMQQVSQMIPLEVINMAAPELIAQTDTNFISLAMMQEKEGGVYPTPEELAAVVAQVRAATLEAYVDNVKQEPLIAKTPKAGKIKKTVENTALGFKELTLSNGAKVILKKTDFKDNEILFSASAKGGYTALGMTNPAEAGFIDQITAVSGLGNFSSTELEKALAGKQVSVSHSVTEYRHGLTGQSTPKDIETLMQLIYLNMTNLTKDEKAFANLQQMYASALANQSNNPSLVYTDSLQSTLYMGNPLFRVPTSEQILAINYDAVLNAVKKLSANAKDYTFCFVGNFDESTLLPLIETYIASLPSKGKTAVNKQIAMASGKVQNVWEKPMQNPQSQATECWSSNNMAYSLRDMVSLDVASRMLDMVYNRAIREELSAAYHAGASMDVETNADQTVRYYVKGDAQLNPDKVNEAVPCFFTGMDKTIAEPNQEDLDKVKAILLKQADVDAKTNGYWLRVLNTFNNRGVDIHTDYKATISSTDAAVVSNFLKDVILKSGNHAEILMKAVPEN